jgi:cytochrome P450
MGGEYTSVVEGCGWRDGWQPGRNDGGTEVALTRTLTFGLGQHACLGASGEDLDCRIVTREMLCLCPPDLDRGYDTGRTAEPGRGSCRLALIC